MRLGVKPSTSNNRYIKIDETEIYLNTEDFAVAVSFNEQDEPVKN